jgi:trehalose 6-phosphate synthase
LSSALLVNPYDPEGVGQAINRALSMPLAERRQRHQANFKALAANDLSRWAERFLATLAKQPAPEERPAARVASA